MILVLLPFITDDGTFESQHWNSAENISDTNKAHTSQYEPSSSERYDRSSSATTASNAIFKKPFSPGDSRSLYDNFYGDEQSDGEDEGDDDSSVR